MMYGICPLCRKPHAATYLGFMKERAIIYVFIYLFIRLSSHVIVLHLPIENCKLIERRRSYIWLTPGGVIIHTPFYLKIVAHVSPGRTGTARSMQNS